jgi:ADP-ribosylglycohydrolase
MSDDMAPYNSFGNGAAMRISPVGFAFSGLDEVLEKARIYTAITHDHREGIKGAQATAASIYLARTGSTKQEIREYVQASFGYDLGRRLDVIRGGYRFNETCQGTVPEAIIAFLESVDFEDAIRNAISLGGDSDTLACITGGIADAYYGGVPTGILEEVLARLDLDLRSVTRSFYSKYVARRGSPAEA